MKSSPRQLSFQITAADIVADLLIEEDAPKQVVLDFESQGMSIHRAKTRSARMATQPQP
jgi:hypothetical protein